jgi:hypothetical protein
MASLAQYSAARLEQEQQQESRPAPGTGTQVMGAAIYAAVFLLVAIAGLLQAAS